MPNYQELYETLFRANEIAIQQLIVAQQQCEELYLKQTEEQGRLVYLIQEDVEE